MTTPIRTSAAAAVVTLLLLGSGCGADAPPQPKEQEPSSISKFVDAPASHRETGTVDRFMDDKGFGFIAPDAGGKVVFVHHSAIQINGFRSLTAGQRVEFDLVQDPKGPRAENVSIIE